MGKMARVSSIDILDTISVALKKFRDEAASAMDDLDVELHRALEWIQHDRKEFWNHERRRAEERVAEAKLQLKQAQSSRRVGDFRPSCVDEQRALERAKLRLQTAEQKVKAVQHWCGVIERAVNSCRRSRTGFSIWLDNDITKAISVLSRMSDSLEDYVSVQVAASTTSPFASPTDSSQEALPQEAPSQEVLSAKSPSASKGGDGVQSPESKESGGDLPPTDDAIAEGMIAEDVTAEDAEKKEGSP